MNTLSNVLKVRLLDLLQPNQAEKGSPVSYVSLPKHLAIGIYHALAVALLDGNALSWPKRHLPGIPVALR